MLYTEHDGKVFYIGITKKSLAKRLNNHISNSNSNKNYYICNKIRKLKSENHKICIEKILSFDSKEEAFQAEQKYIAWCNFVGIKLSNSTKGGESGPSKFGETNPAKRPEVRAKISLAKKGRPRPDLVIRNAKLPKKSVLQYDLKLNFIQKFSSVREAAEKYNCAKSAISNNITGISKTSLGYIWKYEIL